MAWLISFSGIERDVEDLLHEVGGDFLEGGDAVVGIAAVFELVDLRLATSRTSGSAMSSFSPMPKSSSSPLGMGGDGGPLGAFDLLELVNLGSFAVVGAADTVGEKRLEPRIAAHDGWSSLAQRELWPVLYHYLPETAKEVRQKFV